MNLEGIKDASTPKDLTSQDGTNKHCWDSASQNQSNISKSEIQVINSANGEHEGDHAEKKATKLEGILAYKRPSSSNPAGASLAQSSIATTETAATSIIR